MTNLRTWLFRTSDELQVVLRLPAFHLITLDAKECKGQERRTTMRTRSSTHIIILAQPKEFANLSRPLGPQSLRQHLVRESRHLILTLLHHAQRQHGQIHRRNAPPHTLPLSLPSPPGPIAAVTRTQQQADSGRMHDALLHRETLLVVAAGDLEDVAFEFGTDAVAFDFLAHALVHEAAEFALVFDLDEFLGAVGWVGDVELHLDGGGWGVKMMEVVGGKRSDVELDFRLARVCAS